MLEQRVREGRGLGYCLATGMNYLIDSPVPERRPAAAIQFDPGRGGGGRRKREKLKLDNNLYRFCTALEFGWRCPTDDDTRDAFSPF